VARPSTTTDDRRVHRLAAAVASFDRADCGGMLSSCPRLPPSRSGPSRTRAPSVWGHLKLDCLTTVLPRTVTDPQKRWRQWRSSQSLSSGFSPPRHGSVRPFPHPRACIWQSRSRTCPFCSGTVRAHFPYDWRPGTRSGSWVRARSTEGGDNERCHSSQPSWITTGESRIRADGFANDSNWAPESHELLGTTSCLEVTTSSESSAS
jgi:hypothetical protein